MRILMITQWFPPHVSGGSIRAFNAAKGLALIGHDVTVISPFPPPPYVFRSVSDRKKTMVWGFINGIRVVRTWVPFFPDLGLARRLVLFISFMVSSLFPLLFVGDVDVVWAVNPPISSIFPALIYRTFNRCRIFRDVPDLWPESLYDLGLIESRFLKPILDLLSSFSYLVVDGITSISPGYFPVLRQKYGLADEKLHLVEVGVDTIFLHSCVEKSNQIFQRHFNNKFIVMYSGNLGIQYDFQTVLEAAKTLRSYSEILFVIRGWGELKNLLQREIRELDNVILDTKVVDKQTICKILKSADIFLLPMKPLKASERGLPAKLFEYQACGKPIICCSEGEPAKYIKHTESGLVVEPGDPEALAQAIVRLYKNRKLVYELGLNGQRYVSEKLTTQKIGERIYRVFASVKR